MNASFLNLEKAYREKTDISEMTIDGFTFWDRNGNGKLDIYEDNRKSIDERVEDLLSKKELDEKIHVLKIKRVLG